MSSEYSSHYTQDGQEFIASASVCWCYKACVHYAHLLLFFSSLTFPKGEYCGLLIKGTEVVRHGVREMALHLREFIAFAEY